MIVSRVVGLTTHSLRSSAATNSRRWGQAFRNGDYRQQHNRLSFPYLMRMTSSSDNDSLYGIDMDQDAMMESDMLIIVDENDRLIEEGTDSISKKQAHLFSKEQPRGVLHRAFSMFLFNKDNKMLLTQRAGSKITFPSVWTNTCCSHPLRGMTPNEVDDVDRGAYPEFPGIKRAASRKLRHELGIESQYVPQDQMQFITRFHYWAADTMTYGTESTPWGEHEVDYVLFLKIQQDIPIHPCADEVSDYRFVSQQEFKDMLDDSTLSWSPWFRGIVDRGLWQWWDDLDNGTLDGKHTNTNVDFFDPPRDYYASYNHLSHPRTTGVFVSTTAKTD